MFSAVYLINLTRRSDRLAHFRQLQKTEGWHLPEPIIFEAVDGNKTGCPTSFAQGASAYGCLASHTRILEQAIMADLDDILILEDDVIWKKEIWEQLESFMSNVPNDWEQIMLGGQEQQPSQPVNKFVKRCWDTQRTHAYAIRGDAKKSLLNLWRTCNVHIDWVMGSQWQKQHVSYCPVKPFFGQMGGRSDISNRHNSNSYWRAPDGTQPIAIVDAPLDVVDQLRAHGLHFGFSRRLGIDVGLDAALKAPVKSVALKKWFETLSWEVASMEGKIVAAYHPKITPEDFKGIHQGKVIKVKGKTLRQCLRALKEVPLKTSKVTTHVLLLRATRDVVDNLSGFFRGSWLDSISGMDQGIREATVSPDRIGRLSRWLADISAQCERMDAVPLVWHPEIKLSDCAAAFKGRKTVEIDATSPEEVLEKWGKNA